MRSAVGILLVVAMSTHVVARAQGAASSVPPEAIAAARARFEEGARLFEQGNFASALREWETVHSMMTGHPNQPLVLYNIARAYEELRRDSEALRTYERYLSETADREDAPYRTEASERIRELQLRTTLSTPQTGWQPSPIGIAISATGLASVIAGSVVGIVALQQNDRARSTECMESRCTQVGIDQVAEAHTNAIVADALLFGGLAVLVTGVILLITLDQPAASAQARIHCDALGCTAATGIHF